MAKQVSSPPAAKQLDADAYNLALLAGREPTESLCGTLAKNVNIFTYVTIQTAAFGKLTDRDIFKLIAAGPVEAAAIFAAAQQGLLDIQVAHTVKVFIRTIGFKYPKADSAPEDAAVELAEALDHALAEARKMQEVIKKRPRGHQADANLNTFMTYLLVEVSPSLTHERLIDFIGTAILMAVHKGREMLNTVTDGLTRGQQHAVLARLRRYEQLDESAISRRIKRLVAFLKHCVREPKALPLFRSILKLMLHQSRPSPCSQQALRRQAERANPRLVLHAVLETAYSDAPDANLERARFRSAPASVQFCPLAPSLAYRKCRRGLVSCARTERSLIV